MSIIYRIARPVCRVWAVVVVSAAVLVLAPTTARAADVELRSADLDAQLKSAGFDDAQRAKVLGDHALYVTRFIAVVADRLGEWQAIARTHPNTMEDARALQSRGRAAAQAIDDAERPLLESIRTAARPDQLIAVQQVLTLLEIRRDLAFASATREGMFSGRSVDVLEAIDALHLPGEFMNRLQPQCTQYLVERQAVVHRIRDASLNVPLRRVEAKLAHPRPDLPTPSDPTVEQSDANAAQEWMRQLATANAEQTEAQIKSIELDLRTLDAIMPLIGPRDQVRLLKSWCGGAGLMTNSVGRGPAALKRAWSAPSDRVTADVATQIDAICTEWIGAWWPLGKAALIAAARDRSLSMFDMAVGEEESVTTDRAVAATARAVAAIDFALDGKFADPVTVAKSGAMAVQVDGSVGQAVAVVIAGGDGESIEFSLDNKVFSADEMGDAKFQMVGPAGLSPQTCLPKLIQFDEIQPALSAAGVDAAMMEVAKTAVDDLRAEADAIAREAKPMLSRDGYTFDGTFEETPDGTLKPSDPTLRAQHSAQRDALRARLLALEGTRLEEILVAVVPNSGRPCVAWLAPWRQFVSERMASMTAGIFWTGDSHPDPTQAVRAAKFTAQELCAVGDELAAICIELAGGAHAVAVLKEKLGAATAFFLYFRHTADSAAALSAECMKLEGESQRAQKSARTATHASIARLKARLGADAAQRLQDAWDDQLYPSYLKDPTQLTSRFESALALTLSDAVRAQVVALESSWRQDSRALRDKIVALSELVQSQATTSGEVAQFTAEEAAQFEALVTERQVKLKATAFARNETNRLFFRELCTLLGADLAAKLPPLPRGNGKRIGGGISGASFTITAPEGATP